MNAGNPQGKDMNSSGSGPQKILLVVDDEAGIIEEVKSFFEEEGFQVYSADTAKEGIDLVTRLKPHILLLDMRLPDMSGIGVLRISKAVSPQTKVIVNTGYVDQHAIDESERLGRDGFLHKPFDLFVLKEEIDRLLPP